MDSRYQRFLPIGAVLTGNQGQPYDTLELTLEEDYIRSVLQGGWGISGRQDGLDMLKSLLGGRHYKQFKDFMKLVRKKKLDKLHPDDKALYLQAVEALSQIPQLSRSQIEGCESLWGWDLDRIGYLVRMFLRVGYLTEAEAQDWLAKAGARVKKEYRNWEDYLVSVLLGRCLALGRIDDTPSHVAAELLGENRAFLDGHPISAL